MPQSIKPTLLRSVSFMIHGNAKVFLHYRYINYNNTTNTGTTTGAFLAPLASILGLLRWVISLSTTSNGHKKNL